MANEYHVWFENPSDFRIAICRVGASNPKTATQRAMAMLRTEEGFEYVRIDHGMKLARVADHQNVFAYYNCWTLADEPTWTREFRKALTYDQAGDDLIDGSAVKVETILSSIRGAVAPESLWGIAPAVKAELVRLIHEFCEIRCWTWNDPEEQDDEGNDLPCVIHIETPGHGADDEDDESLFG